jgi:transposase
MSKKIVMPSYIAAMERAEADPSAARFWVGLDVGYKNTAVCVLDCDGAIVHQVSMKSSATEIGRYLRKNFKSHVTSSASRARADAASDDQAARAGLPGGGA